MVNVDGYSKTLNNRNLILVRNRKYSRICLIRHLKGITKSDELCKQVKLYHSSSYTLS